MSKSTKFTKEEELLLNTYSSAVSGKGSALFYVNAAVVSAAPVYLFYGVNQMEIADSWIVWTISVIAATYLLVKASKNIKHQLKHKIVMKRSEAVDREINQKYADDKKMSRKEKEERALFRKNEVADNESTYLAIVMNNVMFVTVLLFLAFFMLSNLSPLFNSLFSIVGAAGAVMFLSTSKQ